MEEINKNKKLYILLGILLIILFIIMTNLIKNNVNAKINYNSDEVVADLLESATRIYDREIYYIMEDIITKYIIAYSDYAYDDEQVSYLEYYDVLEKTYKNILGKSKYKEVAAEFFKNVESTNDYGMDSYTYYTATNVIREIYDLGDDMYLCAIGFSDATEYGYIGISIDTVKNTYEIFYLE